MDSGHWQRGCKRFLTVVSSRKCVLFVVLRSRSLNVNSNCLPGKVVWTAFDNFRFHGRDSTSDASGVSSCSRHSTLRSVGTTVRHALIFWIYAFKLTFSDVMLARDLPSHKNHGRTAVMLEVRGRWFGVGAVTFTWMCTCTGLAYIYIYINLQVRGLGWGGAV